MQASSVHFRPNRFFSLSPLVGNLGMTIGLDKDIGALLHLVNVR